jgi:hypothetical protein
MSEPRKAKFARPKEDPGHSRIRKVIGFGTAADGASFLATEALTNEPLPTAELERTIRRTANMSGFDTGRSEADDRAGLQGTLDRALKSLWMA